MPVADAAVAGGGERALFVLDPRVPATKGSWHARVVQRRLLLRPVVAERADLAEEVAAAAAARPRTRGDCEDGPRPCPWVGCRYHLGLEVSRGGGLRFSRPGADLEDLPETCALDIADRGGATLKAVGDALGVTRARVQQIEGQALRRLRRTRTVPTLR